jgi:hypothetical protein
MNSIGVFSFIDSCLSQLVITTLFGATSKYTRKSLSVLDAYILTMAVFAAIPNPIVLLWQRKINKGFYSWISYSWLQL